MLIIYMQFSFVDLVRLTLNREAVPSYGRAHQKLYPEKIPMVLVALCFFNSVLKLSVPMILEETYSMISAGGESNFVMLISIVIVAIGLSQLVLIAYGLMLTLYRLNVKRELSQRIIANNFQDYRNMMESTSISDKADSFSMELWMKISTKLSVYLHNYYESYLSLIFECFNIVVILVYLFCKLSFSLFFGLAIAGLVMYKTIKTANQMTNVRFQNIAFRTRRLKVLESFFSRVTEFKMCWLDKWIHERVSNIQHKFQDGLREIKMLDCWCVALWQFTGVGISSMVITAYFLLGFNESVDKDSVFTPSTFIYLLSMLNFPLNALSWYIAGIRTAERAIHEIQSDVRLAQQKEVSYAKIQEEEQSLVIRQEILLDFDHSHEKSNKDHIKIAIGVKEIRKGRIYSVVGQLGEELLSKLVFLLDDSVKKGYVEENAWLASSSLQSICMQQRLKSISEVQRSQIQHLMELFQCSDIPLHTNTQNYSGGQKLRVSLVRAFNLGEVIIINSNLNSLDKKMKQKVQNSILGLVRQVYSFGKGYTVFIKDNDEIADEVITFKKGQQDLHRLAYKQRDSKQCSKEVISVSAEITNFMQKTINELTQSQKQKQLKQQSLKAKQLSIPSKAKDQKSQVSLSTFQIYYKSPKHIYFAISMLVVTFISNYYNYFVNTYINLTTYDQSQVTTIIVITLVFAVGLFFRSYYFADANLDEAARICHGLNQNIIMQELSFYQSQEKVSEDSEQLNSKSKLICALTSDTETIADHFPFTTNIFANNITVILSSIIVILIEVPQISVLMVLLVAYAHRLNNASHKKDEGLKLALKEKEVEVYKIVSDFQAGRKYVVIHGRVAQFTEAYNNLREQYMAIEWLSDKYRNYINLKYKSVMLLFLIVGVAVYSFVNILSDQQTSSTKSSGLALLIQYTIQLSNYLLFFTMSIWEIKGQAVSIERVRPYLEEKEAVHTRIDDAERVVKKIKGALESGYLEEQTERLIDIKQLSFAYEANVNTPIFKALSLQVNKGDKIIIKGRSGSGKTTLYKLLTSAYPKILNLVNQPYHISFSPQHPLPLPDTNDITQNLNPYGVIHSLKEIGQTMQKHGLNDKSLDELSYEQKIVVNNLRAYLHGYKGVTIYDEPIEVTSRGKETLLIVTHHHEFKHNKAYELVDGQLISIS